VASQSGYSGTPELAVDPHYTSDAHPGAMLVEVVATEMSSRGCSRRWWRASSPAIRK
jgi:hypothetical protein